MALTDNLVSFWELEEASGTRNDSSGTNHLTDNNTVTQAAGIAGFCAQFTLANSESLSINDNSSFDTGDIDLTLCAWVNLNSKPVTDMSIIGKWESAGNQREYELYWNHSTDTFDFIASSTGTGTINVSATSFGTPSLGAWYFIVARHNSTADTISICVDDGAVDSSGFDTAGIFNGTAIFRIGAARATPIEFFDGGIDQVGFWKRLLTAGEITQLYNSGEAITYSDMVGRRFIFGGH